MAEVLKILLTARGWLEDGQTVYLFHVAQAWGSSPRPVGSLMAVNSVGQHIGSVSGGCVEADLFTRIQNNEFCEQSIRLIEYSNETHHNITLPCRGHMQILLETMHDSKQLQPIIEAIESRSSILRQVHIDPAQVTYSQTPSSYANFDGQILNEPYGPAWRVLLIGANDLAMHVARQCLLLDYEVVISEPREEYRQNWLLCDCELTPLMPDEAVEKYVNDEHSAVLALTHDPKLDDLAILQALYSPAFYIGALGSKRSAERRKDTMSKMDLNPLLLDKLDAPIGLNIGSRSPAEISVAIAARLIQVRNTNIPSIPSSWQQQA